MPGRREGQILSYPQRKWVKKRYQYLQHFLLPKHLRYIAESAPSLGETPVIGVIITLFFFHSATLKFMQPFLFYKIRIFSAMSTFLLQISKWKCSSVCEWVKRVLKRRWKVFTNCIGAHERKRSQIINIFSIYWPKVYSTKFKIKINGTKKLWNKKALKQKSFSWTMGRMI